MILFEVGSPWRLNGCTQFSFQSEEASKEHLLATLTTPPTTTTLHATEAHL